MIESEKEILPYRRNHPGWILTKRILKGILILFVLWILFRIFCSPGAPTTDITYQGKVIDKGTLKPIEGAVVVAVWNKWYMPLVSFEGSETKFKDAKEILTDKNGDWAIVGPKGQNRYVNEKKSWFYGIHYTVGPTFTIYRPGYKKYGSLGCFSAYPCINKEHNLEGIVLYRSGDTWPEVRKFLKKHEGSLPFIPAKDPEKKLRKLDFSFQYPEEVKEVGSMWCSRKGIEPFAVYTIVGLPKARTRKERLDAMPGWNTEELPLASKINSEERERLFGPDRRNKK